MPILFPYESTILFSSRKSVAGEILQSINQNHLHPLLTPHSSPHSVINCRSCIPEETVSILLVSALPPLPALCLALLLSQDVPLHPSKTLSSCAVCFDMTLATAGFLPRTKEKPQKRSLSAFRAYSFSMPVSFSSLEMTMLQE